MNLAQTVDALSRFRNEKFPEGIIVAEDLGVHHSCHIDSNCPLAVRLRQLMEEIGITLVELAASIDNEPERPSPFAFSMPTVDGRIEVRIAGQSVPLDITSWISPEIAKELRDKRADCQEMERQVVSAGRSLYNTYLTAIKRAKEQEVLPQLQFSMESLLSYKCLITRDASRYLILFPIAYSPCWVWTRGFRYQLKSSDVKSLQRAISVVFPITTERNILTVYLTNQTGGRFQHYHGSNGDCWGDVLIPSRWNGSLKQLADVAYQLQGALATINKDSLMLPHPSGMINIGRLMDRATLLGKEGEKKEEPRLFDEEDPLSQRETPDVPRRWGQGG